MDTTLIDPPHSHHPPSKRNCRVWNPGLEVPENASTNSNESSSRNSSTSSSTGSTHNNTNVDDDDSSVRYHGKDAKDLAVKESSPPIAAGIAAPLALIKRVAKRQQEPPPPPPHPMGQNAAVFNNYLQMFMGSVLVRLHHQQQQQQQQQHLLAHFRPSLPPPPPQSNHFMNFHPPPPPPFLIPHPRQSAPANLSNLRKQAPPPPHKRTIKIGRRKGGKATNKEEMQQPNQPIQAPPERNGTQIASTTINPIVQSVWGSVLTGKNNSGVTGIAVQPSTGVNFNTCAICGTSFRMTTDLVQHMRANHRVSKYKRKGNETEPGKGREDGRRS